MKSATTTSSSIRGRALRLSLGTKLAAGCAALTALTIIEGAVFVYRTGSMGPPVAMMRDTYFPSIRDVGHLAIAVQQARAAEAGYVMCRGPAPCAAAAGTLQAALAQVDQARLAYGRLNATAEERDRYASAFDRRWAAYRNDDLQIRKAKGAGANDAAHAIFATASADDLDALTTFLNQDLDDNASAGRKAATEATDWLDFVRRRIMMFMVIVVLVSFLIALALIRHISRPLVGMTAAMSRLAGRDLATSIPCIGRTDEIGAMAAAVQVFRDGMIAADRLAAEQRAEREARQERSARIENLVRTFETQIGSTVSILATASTEMETTAASMTGNAAQTDRQAVAVAQAAEESSLGVQTVAAASEQLASSITEINRQVASSSTLTGAAVDSVRRTDETVRTLSESADRIGQVVSLISSIASQTNLLALNATIEAARAGDAGKGFAVVASEVKSLAQQTARATDEIAAQVAQVQQATGGAVEAIREIGGIIEQVGAITTSIAAAVEQQGAATAEIARNVQQTAVSTQVVTSNIAGVSRAANDTGAAAGQVLDAAGGLSRQAGQLSSEVNSFIASVRSA